MQWTIKRGVTTFAVASAFAVLSASAIGQSPESKPAAQPTQPASAKLVRSHPELAGRAAVRGEMTAASTREQGGAGLAQLTPEEFARLQDLNKRYSEKFGFPFVMAVRGYDRQDIIDALATRLNNDRDTELRTSLEQIDRIAGFRLNDLISG